MESDDPRANLLSLSEENAVSLSALSRMLGKNPSYLQQFVRKGSPRKLDETDRGKLARFFGIEEHWLGQAQDISYAEPGAEDWLAVPRLALGAAAGAGAISAEEQSIGALRFSRAWLREQGLASEALSAIEVTGDSMEPTLRDGDEILVERSATPARDGIHVVRRDETLLVKRVDLSSPGRITLISDNRAYPPYELPLDEVEIVGRVVWKGGRL